MLEAKVRIPVTYGSPFDRLDTSKLDLAPDQAAQVIPVLASPIGLALPEPDDSVKKFNLLPPEVAQKARIKRIQERTLIGSVAVIVLLVLFGGWKFLQVHNEQNNVNQLNSNIASLNAQVPKYSLVVAANEAYTKGLARRASVLNQAIDWPLALNSLISITPAKASVLTFNGSELTATEPRATSSTAPAAPPRRLGDGHPVGRHRHDQPAGQRPRSEPLDLRGLDQRHLDVAVLRQPGTGRDDRRARLVHLLPLHHLGHPGCQPQQECEPQMNQVREYRNPLLIAGGALVVAIILWLALISPQNSKLSSLQAQSTTLQAQEAALQAKLTALESEGQKLSSNCADLVRISTQIPSVQTPTDVDAEESSFESQFNSLAGTSGVSLAQFSGFTPAGATATGAVAVPATSTAAAAGSTTPADVTAVPTTLTVQGNYGQIIGVRQRTGHLPPPVRDPEVRPQLRPGRRPPAPARRQPPPRPSSSGTASATLGNPLWVGGTPTAASAGPYNLQITGSIYYTSTPNALSACTKATAAQSATK